MSAHSPNGARRERGRYAALRRSRADDDPELMETHRRIREAALVAAIERSLKNSSPLTAELYARIVALLADQQEAT